MKFCRASAFFLSAAASALSVPAIAEDLWNLSGNAELTIAADATTTVRQQIDGVFTGTISGDGNFVKAGDANLTLGGAISLSASGSMSVAEGSLTLGAGVELPAREFTVANAGTLVLATDSADALAQLVVSGEGIVVSVDAGTTNVQELAGTRLDVNAGTLVVRNSTAFDEVRVLSGATLQLGTGKTDSLAQLSGDVRLEAGATLVFNRAAISGESANVFRYSGEISGAGDVVFSGSRAVYFTGGVDQTYAGTTTVNAGGMIFERATQIVDGTEYYDPDAKAATLSSAAVRVNGGGNGMFGGHVTVRGDVDVRGTEFSSVAAWESAVGKNSWGAWYAGAGTLFAGSGHVLTIEGDLTIAGTRLETYVVDSEADAAFTDGVNLYNIRGNGGGAARVEFGAAGAGKIVANGNVELGGTLVLVGADGIAAGQTAVIFESDPAKTTGAFDQVVYGSDNVTLLLPGVGGIQEGQYGIATTENRRVRERASFDEHEGLGDFVDYLMSQSDEMNKIAQAVALAGSDSVTDVVNNFSPLAFSAYSEMALRQSDGELDMILLEISRARAARPDSRDGVRVPANFTFFSGLLTEFVDHESGNAAPVYDFDSLGVYAGGRTWLDDERLIGATLGLHRSSARPHGGGGSLDDSALRAKIFAAFAPKFSEWFLTVGGNVGLHYYDSERETLIGANSGSTDGIDAGVFVALNFRQAISEDLFFLPYLRFEYNFSYVGGFEETGSASRLDVSRITTNTYSARAGAGLEYFAADGKVFGVDFGFVGTFGERPQITSEFVEYAGSRTTTRGTLGEPMLVEIAPRFEIDLGDGCSAGAVFRVQCSFDGALNQSFGIGFSKEF